jgi:phosphomannomutase
MLVAMLAAIQAGKTVSELFAALPQRCTQAGLINNFPVAVSESIISKFSKDTPETREELERYFTPELGFGSVSAINTLDGVRIFFSNNDVAHIRPSNNAPQLRIYSVADSQERANEIASLALSEPDGIFRRMQHEMEPASNASPAS